MKVATLSRVHHLYNLQCASNQEIRPFHSAVICRTFVPHSTRGRFHRHWYLTVILLNTFLMNHLKRQDIEQHRSEFLVANQAKSWSDDAKGSPGIAMRFRVRRSLCLYDIKLLTYSHVAQNDWAPPKRTYQYNYQYYVDMTNVAMHLAQWFEAIAIQIPYTSYIVSVYVCSCMLCKIAVEQ